MATTYSEAVLPPGFRFHPTDEELILHYLHNRASSLPCPVHVITDLDIYKFDPWELPDKAVFGEKEWYFFTPRDRKYPNGMRPNRAARTGYWKATGTDKPISTTSSLGNMVTIGVKKALVFYVGKPPRGTKSCWIMHEYRLAGPHAAQKPTKMLEYSMRLDDWVLCRIYKKNSQPSVNPQVNNPHSPMEVFTSPVPAIAPQTTTSAAGDVDLFSMMMGGTGSHGQTFQMDGEALGAPLATNTEGCFERNRRSVEGHSYILQQSSTAAYMQMLMGSHLNTGEDQ